jgi:predicted DNA-binding transcriptional regulator AlpA
VILDPARAQDVPTALVPEFIANMARLKIRVEVAMTALSHRLPTVYNTGKSETGDRLLSAKQAAEKLGRSTDWLYEQASRLPFTVRDGSRVMFSVRGMERWIANKQKAR